MIEKFLIKNIRTLFIVFVVLLGMFVLNYLGLFAPVHRSRLEHLNRIYRARYSQFIQSKLQITQLVARDAIIQSAIIQYGLSENLISSLKHLNMYKKSFSDLRGITLFNSAYNIILTTELDNYIIHQNLNKDWFISSLTRNYYISDVHYNSRYNEFLLSLIVPVKNIVQENIGYLMIDCSLEKLLKGFAGQAGVVTAIRRDNLFLFTYPFSYQIKKDKDLSAFSLVAAKPFMDDYVLVTAAEKSFFALPLYLMVLGIISFSLVVVSLLYFILDKYLAGITFTQDNLRKIVDEIVKGSQSIAVEGVEQTERTVVGPNEAERDREFLQNRKEKGSVDKGQKEKKVINPEGFAITE